MTTRRDELMKEVCDFLYAEIDENEEFVNLDAVSSRLVDKIILSDRKAVVERVVEPLKNGIYIADKEAVYKRANTLKFAIDQSLSRAEEVLE